MAELSSIIIGNTEYKFKDETARSSHLTDISWSTGTDEEIVAVVAALDAGTITTDDLMWAVGDERTVSLNAASSGAGTNYSMSFPAQDATFVIMKVGPYNDVGNYVIGVKNTLRPDEKMGNTDYCGWGWSPSTRGYQCCETIFNMIPSSLQPVFKTFTVYTAKEGGYTDPIIKGQSGKLALFAEKEIIGGKTQGSCSTDSEINDSRIPWIPYYYTSANRIKHKWSDAGQTWIWWLRSPYYLNNQRYCMFSQSGTPSANMASYEAGFSPFGVI